MSKGENMVERRESVATRVAEHTLFNILNGEVSSPTSVTEAISALIDAKIADALPTALSQPNDEGEGK